MATKIFGKIVHCINCDWSGPVNDAPSMAGYEFCPVCNHGHVGSMPEVKAPSREESEQE